ncbi:MAG: DUF1801 domain-containing protein [Gemmatimonadetes bacterium]|nr:DUF1801 domain-containing protein [Gemmatimonadota bacterium]
MQSKATTVAAYLKSLPADRRKAIEAVRAVVRKSVDKDIEEGMQYGMIGWYVPHRVFPAGYHCDPAQPVPYAALASQKNHMALYLMCAYTEKPVEEFIRAGYAAAGKKLDMGKSCIRFRTLEELDLDTIAEAIRMTPGAVHIRNYVRQVGEGAWKKRAPAAKKAAATKKAPAAKARPAKRKAAARKK